MIRRIVAWWICYCLKHHKDKEFPGYCCPECGTEKKERARAKRDKLIQRLEQK